MRSGGVYQIWSKGNANGISYGRCLNFVAFQFTLFFPCFLFGYFNRKWWRHNLSLLNLLLPSWPSKSYKQPIQASWSNPLSTALFHHLIFFWFLDHPCPPPMAPTDQVVAGGGGRLLWWWWWWWWCGFTT